MVEAAHRRLSISAQCRLLGISRSSYYYAPVPETDETLALMTVIDETFIECPWYGSRQMARHLRRAGHEVGRRRARRLMAKMGLTPIYQRPRTSDSHPQHRIYPYLLRKLAIERPNHVWCADLSAHASRVRYYNDTGQWVMEQALELDPSVGRKKKTVDMLYDAGISNGDRAIGTFLTKKWTPDLIAEFGEAEKPRTIRRWRKERGTIGVRRPAQMVSMRGRTGNGVSFPESRINGRACQDRVFEFR
jgi:hypothetical protein